MPSTPPCDGKLVHPKNGLVMLPDLAYCLQHSGLLTAITTPEILDTAFSIPSIPAVTPTEESRNLMLHNIRSALKEVPTLDVTPELVSELVDKIHQQLFEQKTTSNPLAMGQRCIHLKSCWSAWFLFMVSCICPFGCLGREEVLQVQKHYKPNSQSAQRWSTGYRNWHAVWRETKLCWENAKWGHKRWLKRNCRTKIWWWCFYKLLLVTNFTVLCYSGE